MRCWISNCVPPSLGSTGTAGARNTAVGAGVRAAYSSSERMSPMYPYVACSSFGTFLALASYCRIKMVRLSSLGSPLIFVREGYLK